MSTIAKLYKPNVIRIKTNLITIMLNFIEKSMPRRCIQVSVGLFLAGMSIPTLMILHLLQPTFLLDLLALALVASGGVIALIFCGEI
ncbi:MAG: hypothetical protein WCK35_07205 [Chloroflexota bacterium]